MSIEEIEEILPPEPSPANKPDDREMCTICLEPLFSERGVGAVRIFECGHKFHYACVKGGETPLSSCPNCRTDKLGNLCEKCFVKIDTAFIVGPKAYYSLCASCVMSKLKHKVECRKRTIFRFNRALMQLETQLARYDESVEAGIVEYKEGYVMMRSELSTYFSFMDRLITELF